MKTYVVQLITTCMEFTNLKVVSTCIYYTGEGVGHEPVLEHGALITNN